jgi:hypothetical protein
MTGLDTGSSGRDAPDVRVTLSTLWVVAMFNYLYADVITLMNPSQLKMMMTGSVGPLQITQGFMLGAAILMETAIAMVLLSRVLAYRANRVVNISAGGLHTAAVLSSMFVGTPALHSIFFAAVEVGLTLFIIGYAWRWKEQASLAKVRIPKEAVIG